MGGDEIRWAAARVRQAAEEASRCAEAAAAAATVAWQSPAATRFRQRLGDEVCRIRRAASRLENAAEALNAHAVMVDADGPAAIAGVARGGGA